MAYLWLKVGHIVSFTAWFAGIFYIWRLHVYHAENPSPEVKSQLGIMAEKLYRIIMTPAFICTIAFGISLFYMRWDALKSNYWIWVKIALVVLVGVNHFMAGLYAKRLRAGKEYSGKRFRLLNEMPTLLLVLIVILAVLKDSLWS